MKTMKIMFFVMLMFINISSSAYCSRHWAQSQGRDSAKVSDCAECGTQIQNCQGSGFDSSSTCILSNNQCVYDPTRSSYKRKHTLRSEKRPVSNRFDSLVADSGKNYVNANIDDTQSSRRQLSAGCPAETFCDADGFQLAMQFSSNSIFNFDSNYWTDETLLGTNGEGISNKDGKYKPFNDLPATEIKICAISCVKLTIPDSHSGLTLKEIFSSVTIGPTGLEFDSSKIEEFRAAFGAPASNHPYQKLKLNFDDTDSSYQCKGRLALIQNNESNHVTANDAIGLGAQEAHGNGAGAAIAIYSNEVTNLQAQLYVKGDDEPTTLLPSSTPTECPTPEVGDFGGDLITYNTSTVLPNGRIHLDFIYSSAVITDFDITMDKPGFDYSSEDANGWTEDLEMCWSSINREFTYNQMSKAMDFEVYATQVLFAVDTSYEYSKHKSVTIGGQVHEWTETHTRSKHIPFEFTLPEKSVITTAFSGKNSPFIINTRAPTTSMPTFMPTTSIPTVMPSNEPTSSEPTNAPIASQPTIGPITSTPTTIPSASPITEPTQAPVTSRPTSTPFEPTVTPTTSGPTAKPSSSPTATNPSMAPSTSEPTLTPTLSPSFSPTFEPTMMPSYSPTDFPSLEPSANPLPTSDVITTIVPYISTETAQKGQNPLMEVQFTTIVNMPWKLIEPRANGSAITNLLSFQPTQQDTCDNFADLEQEFLKQSILYCQRWVLRFEGDRHCNNQPRALHIDFISEADNGQRSPTTLSWDLDLGSSPAFECAHDLGTFQVSVQVEGHNDANGDFTSPSKAYLDEFYYFRFTGSSGAPVTSLSVTNLDVQNAETSEFICQACQLKQELKWSLKDMDVDNYITALELDSSVFAGLRFVTFDFTIEVEMSADTGRRRLAETGEKLHQKVTLSLDSSTRQGGPRTDPPTVYTSSTSKAPTPFATTKSPVATADDGTVEQSDDIIETEVDASESASESAQVPVWIFIAIGAVASAIIAAVAYRFITQSNDKDIQFKDAVTPSGVGSSYNPALKIDVKA